MYAGSGAARPRYKHTDACTYTHAGQPAGPRWLLLRGLRDVPLLGSKCVRARACACRVPEDPLLCVTGLILLIVLHLSLLSDLAA